MDYFVSKNSVVRTIWGKADTVLFIFAGAAAEFALNKAVDWLYFTGRLPASTGEVLEAMDHHLPDGGVCRHPVTDTDPVLWHRTLATVAVDVRARTLHATADGPCGHRLLPVEQPA